MALFFFLLKLMLLVVVSLQGARAWTCYDTCGGIPIKYPFGTSIDCGSPIFQPHANCTDGRYLLYTPTGVYPITQIDYESHIMIIQDPSSSTCSSSSSSSSSSTSTSLTSSSGCGGFGLAVGSPFSIAHDSNTFILLGCASTSSLYSSGNGKLCESSSNHICDAFYNCPGVSGTGSASSCCVYSSSQFSKRPYQINLSLLQCTSYASIYSFGGNQDSPSSWSFGIALHFYFDQSPPSPSSPLSPPPPPPPPSNSGSSGGNSGGNSGGGSGCGGCGTCSGCGGGSSGSSGSSITYNGNYGTCQGCQQTNGVCGYNTYGFVCICGNGFNTSTHCGDRFGFGISGSPPSPSSRSLPLLFLVAATTVLLMGAISYLM